jgi:(p)ppGpp synthase/HD superfamily hydrolase
MPTTSASPNNQAGALRHRLLLGIENFKVTDKVMIGKALSLAEQIHGKESRRTPKFTPTKPAPYIVHPMRVALIILEELELKEPIAIASALLHDVVESSKGKTSIGSLEESFGRPTAMMVSILTKPPMTATDTAVEKEQKLNTYYGRISHASVEAKLVKLADRLDNTRDALDLLDKAFQQKYLEETRKIYLPLAEQTDSYLYDELILACQRLEHDIKFA